jgi:glucose/arabinose dehydrogenase
MDPDGKNQQIFAHGLRNVVDMTFVPSIDNGALFVTNMGDDHLGDQAPEDTFFEADSNLHPVPPGSNYGWPTCYFDHGVVHPDPVVSHADLNQKVFPPIGVTPPQFDCAKVPLAYTTFTPHASPLGVAFFNNTNRILLNTFLVALHGAGKPHIGTGYRVVRFTPSSRHPQNFMLGFLVNGKVIGRPCGIFQTRPDSFLLTDDVNGVIYSIHPKG